MPVLINVFEITEYSELSVMYATVACIIYLINCTVSENRTITQVLQFRQCTTY